MGINVGEKAPDFNLSDQNGEFHSLKDQKGKWVLLYFYPRDNTPGCTKEACTIRDTFPDFMKLDIVVFGCSADSQESHKKFAEKQRLPFILLSDNEKKVMRAYGAWAKKKLLGREYMGIIRSSVLIDPKGKIAKIYSKVKPAEHAQEVLEDVENLK